MNDHYEVTIGIPVYRSAAFIRDTMLSVLSQTFADIEFLVVDDCGEDGSVDQILLLQKTHPRGKHIRILENGTNRGVSYSRNRIIDEARGRYLYFMDSDDIIEPQTIQILHDAIVRNHAQIAYGSYDIADHVNGNPVRVYQKEWRLFHREDDLALYAFQYIQIFHVSACNHLVDLEFLRQTGIRFANVSYWEDMIYTTELVTRITRAVTMPDVTYHYILHTDSLSHYRQRERLNKKEIQQNVAVLNYLKRKCSSLTGKPYLSFLAYNIEVNSFYVVCHILKNVRRIHPRYSFFEMREMLAHPLSLATILRFRQNKVSNSCFWVMGKLPLCLFAPVVWMLGKSKRCI